MSVSLQPSATLGFPRPLTQLVKRSLSISNHNDRPVAFKVKTTAPKFYCVRPNSGRVEPGETVEVSVMLQAMKEDPPLNAKCKDKFLIQSTLITKEKEDKPLQDIWNVSDSAVGDEKVHQQKLKVQYLRAEGQTLEEEEEPHANPSSLLASGESQFETVRQTPAGNGQPPAAIPEFNRSTEDPQHIDFSNAHEIQPVEIHDEPLSADASAPESEHVSIPPVVPIQEPREPSPVREHATASAPSPRDDEIYIKFQEAEAEIERLRSLLATSAQPPVELRKRSRRYSDADTVATSDVGTYVDEAPLSPEGVPLQIVVIIALAVFITTYLFF